jgi:hypothetical protein
VPASWVFDLVDRAGRSVTSGGLTLARDITLTFQGESNPNSVQLVLPADCAEAAIILQNPDALYYVKAYRTPDRGSILDRRLRFYGSVEVDEVQGKELILTAVDPLGLLASRYALSTVAAQDAGTTIRQLVNTSNSNDGETGIQTNASWVTSSVSLPFDGAQSAPSILAVMQEYSGTLDGPDCWVEPVEYAAGKIGRLYISPGRGVDSGAVFGYGFGTVANTRSMGRVIDRSKIANDIRASGEGVTAANQTDATSITALGRRVEYVQYTGEPSVSVVRNNARGRLNRRSRPLLIAEYSCEPDYGSPEIFDDFNIGDTVTLDYRYGNVRWIAKPRVVSATITVNNAGREQPAELAFYAAGEV